MTTSMSQPPAPYTGRGAFSTKLPDRTVPSGTFVNNNPSASAAPQMQFGQSAPAFARQPQFPQSQSQTTYGGFPQHTVGTGYGTGRGPLTGRATGPGVGVEKESNVLNELSDEQKDEINEAFTIFDLDKDRHLDFHELRVALRALGFNPHKSEVVQIITTNGTPKPTAQRLSTGRGQPTYHPSQLLISQHAFTRIAAQKMLDRDPLEEIERAFYLFDADHKDFINIDDLRRVTRELGETSLEEQELLTMIEEFDYEGIGGVSKEAFFGICLQ